MNNLKKTLSEKISSRKKLVRIEDYEPWIGGRSVDRILKKARLLKDLHVVHVNSTYYGGGVSVLLSSLTLLMNTLGIKTGWRLIQGEPDFFAVTKKMHNALQGGRMNLSERKKRIYEDVIYQNSVRNHLEEHDVVVIHDPQPLPLITHYRKKAPWIWRCHIDMTQPQKEVWDYLKQFVELYDAVIFSLKDYRQKLKTPQFFFMPAIDPFTIKNKELTDRAIQERLKRYQIPTDLPLVVQISRFDRWKDPEGVVKAFKLASKKAPCTLVLIGNVATDDPEGEKVYQTLLKNRGKRIIVSSYGDDTALVNALQRRAAVILQKSIREGFGLTVAEAMWKGTPVIGGNVGGIRYQIKDGENGFLVSSVAEAAERIVLLVKNKDLREKMGKEAKEAVRRNFLLPRYLEQHLDLLIRLTSS
ncbi:MAG: glycosyltransferase [Candidatus Omnitrophica bacterium]|nr:glycosyltransferase [Candidatus Omnitrophota bacterium]